MVNLSGRYNNHKHIHTKDIAQKYMKQNLTELKRERDNSMVIAEDFNTPLSVLDRTTRQKIDKDVEDLSNTINYL